MMEIEDLRVRKYPRTVTLTDIPVGQVFRGEVFGAESGVVTTGIFFKSAGQWRSVRGGPIDMDGVVVRLDGEGAPGHINLWVKGSNVKNYDPLDVKLVIKA